jgi:hypothetical protein
MLRERLPRSYSPNVWEGFSRKLGAQPGLVASCLRWKRMTYLNPTRKQTYSQNARPEALTPATVVTPQPWRSPWARSRRKTARRSILQGLGHRNLRAGLGVG